MVAAIFVGATDFGLYFLLIHFLSFSLAKTISFTCAGIVAYVFNKHWIFRYNKLSSFHEVGRYLIINLLTLGLNVGINQGILNVWPHAILPAIVIAAMLTGCATFISYKWWVFRVALQDATYFSWWQWLPWRFLLKDAARRQGFPDPIRILSQLQNFAQPSEVAAPLELLRSGVVLHARGLINSLAIQHNLDWIWPYWVECQYDPRNVAFIPRSFSLTQINLTHRNWTALGVPDGIEFPLVDPRGLVTPFYDSWSIDAWIIPEEGKPLIPSRCLNVSQKMGLEDGLCVITASSLAPLRLQLKAEVIGPAEAPVLRVNGEAITSVVREHASVA